MSFYCKEGQYLVKQNKTKITEVCSKHLRKKKVWGMCNELLNLG